MNKLIVLGLLAIVLIAGCSSSTSIISCEPNWKLLSEYVINEEYCDSWCYQGFQTNHYKIETPILHQCICKLPYHNITQTISQEGNYSKNCIDICKRIFNVTDIEITSEPSILLKCYCDVNNCNP